MCFVTGLLFIFRSCGVSLEIMELYRGACKKPLTKSSIKNGHLYVFIRGLGSEPRRLNEARHGFGNRMLCEGTEGKLHTGDTGVQM